MERAFSEENELEWTSVRKPVRKGALPVLIPPEGESVSTQSNPDENFEAIAAKCGYQVERFAEKLGLSARHLRRIFQKRFNANPKQKIDEWRARAALDQIKRGDLVKTAASDHDFKYASHLSKFFKRVLKSSPRDFRQP